jgi:hypothetical protein
VSALETLQTLAQTRGFSGDAGSDDDRRAVIEYAREIGATLDGHPAAISGVSLDFAAVSTLPKSGKGPRYSVEWAWQSAAHVLLNGGRFES